MSSAIETWQELVLARQVQMDAAYARLLRSSDDFWERRADRFRAFSQSLPDDDLGLRLLRRLTGADSTVLDVGAGAGRYALAISPHVRRVVAVEPNAALAAHLRADAEAKGARTVEVVEVRWEEAEVEAADLVLCSHVLYPHADVVPFIRKLEQHAREACLVLVSAAWGEPPLLLELWQRFHGEPRVGQPDARHVFDVLYEMGIPPNVEVAPMRQHGGQWSFATIEEAVAMCREHLILPPDPDLEPELRDALLAGAEPLPEGGLRLPGPPRLVAALWWRPDGPRLDATTAPKYSER
jgi:SAM-dependent methyltransferase